MLNQLLKNAPWVLRGNINTYNPINIDNISLLNIFLLSLKKQKFFTLKKIIKFNIINDVSINENPIIPSSDKKRI